LVSIMQSDSSFQSEWPGQKSELGMEKTKLDSWVRKLQTRLKAKGSRLRERSGCFLFHQIFDLCADDLVHIIRAYSVWLSDLRQRHPDQGQSEWARATLSLGQLQLTIVLRRIKNFQRVLATIRMDKNLAALEGYWQDVADHLEEAYEDGMHTMEWCTKILASMKNAARKRRKERQSRTADWMNNTLFVLTVGMSVFAPVQFLVGVYGMNFCWIPELNTEHGYYYFWCFVLVYFVVVTLLAIKFYRRLAMDLQKSFPVRGVPPELVESFTS